MNSHPHEDEYQDIRHFVAQLFPNPDSLTLTVSPQLQAEELSRLRLGRRPEQFTLVTNLLTVTIEHAMGMEELGYADATFSFRQYLRCMPNPGILRNSILLSKQLFGIVADVPAVQFLRPRFVANLPMRHANGEVLLVKRTLAPWQLSSAGQITHYLSDFQIIKPYEGEPMSPRFFDVAEPIREKFYKAVYRLFATLSASKNPFSPRELGLLSLYLTQTGTRRPSAKVIAEEAGLSVLMVKDYNKSILAKAKGLFGDDLPVETAYEVAVFLRRTGLI